MRYLKYLVLCLFSEITEASVFDFSKSVESNHLTPAYWILEHGHSPHSLLTNGLLPLEYSYRKNLTGMTDLLHHYSGPLQSNDVSITHAVIEDATDIAYVHTNSWNHTYRNILPIRNIQDSTQNWVSRLATNFDNHHVLISKLNGRTIAFLGYEVQNKTLEIKGLYVHPAFHRLRAGTMLLKYFLKENTSQVYLWVYEKNFKAISFYKTMNFRQIKTESKKYPGTNVKLIRLDLLQ